MQTLHSPLSNHIFPKSSCTCFGLVFALLGFICWATDVCTADEVLRLSLRRLLFITVQGVPALGKSNETGNNLPNRQPHPVILLVVVFLFALFLLFLFVDFFFSCLGQALHLCSWSCHQVSPDCCFVEGQPWSQPSISWGTCSSLCSLLTSRPCLQHFSNLARREPGWGEWFVH